VWDEAIAEVTTLKREADSDRFMDNSIQALINDMYDAEKYTGWAWDAYVTSEWDGWVNAVALIEGSCASAYAASYIMSTGDF